MIREALITVYLAFFYVLFTIFKLFPIQKKVTFVVSFGDNSKYVYDEMRKQSVPFGTVFLCASRSAHALFGKDHTTKALDFRLKRIGDFISSIYHLATSRYIIVDNYFGFLAVTRFKEGVECIQLWHAGGAIKKFGYEDQSNATRSERALKRFGRVYENFHKIVVGSDAMEDIFKKAFRLGSDHFLKTGMPRSDFFFDKCLHQEIIEKLKKENPSLIRKKTILYAPTYRDGELDEFRLQLDLDLMEKELKNEWIVLLRLHPAVKSGVDYGDRYPGFVFDYTGPRYDINELLLVSDLLISDYSSIPYEFALLNKPMIFFPYDLESYTKERGLWAPFSSMVPGPVVMDTAGILHEIKSGGCDTGKVSEFSRVWNKYSTGKSSENLVKYLLYNDAQKDQEKQKAL